jgi:hypothetical protein
MVAGLIAKLAQVDLQRLWWSLAPKSLKPTTAEDIIKAGAVVE